MVYPLWPFNKNMKEVHCTYTNQPAIFFNTNLAGILQTTPPLAILMLCCSMASNKAWCCWDILSNSSMQQMPWSAKTKAPASKPVSPDPESLSVNIFVLKTIHICIKITQCLQLMLILFETKLLYCYSHWTRFIKV